MVAANSRGGSLLRSRYSWNSRSLVFGSGSFIGRKKEAKFDQAAAANSSSSTSKRKRTIPLKTLATQGDVSGFDEGRDAVATRSSYNQLIARVFYAEIGLPPNSAQVSRPCFISPFMMVRCSIERACTKLESRFSNKKG